MYFSGFPYTLYSLDDRVTVKLIKNILLRVVLKEKIKTNLSLFDEYDIRDGDTPEIIADKFYNNPELHWIILHLNEILDPRFNWVHTTNNLVLYVDGKYPSRDGIHHYEDDSTGEQVNGNIFIQSAAAFSNFYPGNVIINNTNTGTAYITSKISTSNINAKVTVGGFKAGDQIKLLTNSSITANVTQTTTIPGMTAVTNLIEEDRLNESRRRIKILKPQYVGSVITELTNILEQANEQ